MKSIDYKTEINNIHWSKKKNFITYKKILVVFIIIGSLWTINYILNGFCGFFSTSSVSCKLFGICSEKISICRLYKVSEIIKKNDKVSKEIVKAINKFKSKIESRSYSISDTLQPIIISLKIIMEVDEIKLNGHLINLFTKCRKTARHDIILRKSLRQYYLWSNKNIKNIKNQYKNVGLALENFINIQSESNYEVTTKYKNSSSIYKIKYLSTNLKKNSYSLIENNEESAKFLVLEKMNEISSNLEMLLDHTSHVISHLSNYINLLKNLKSQFIHPKTKQFVDGPELNKKIELVQNNIDKNKNMYRAACLLLSSLALLNPANIILGPICELFNYKYHQERSNNLKITKTEIIGLESSIDVAIAVIADQLFQIQLIKKNLNVKLKLYDNLTQDMANSMITYKFLLNKLNFNYLSKIYKKKLIDVKNNFLQMHNSINNENYISFKMFDTNLNN